MGSASPLAGMGRASIRSGAAPVAGNRGATSAAPVPAHSLKNPVRGNDGPFTMVAMKGGSFYPDFLSFHPDILSMVPLNAT